MASTESLTHTMHRNRTFSGWSVKVSVLKSLLIASLFILFTFKLSGQTSVIKGKIIDSQDNSDVVGAVVMLKNTKDTLQKKGVTTNLRGYFNFAFISYGDYELVVKYLGYKPFKIHVNANQPVINLSTLKLVPDSASIGEVDIVAHIIPMKQNGDTIEYNANAFPTDPDAELEDLLARLPGITVDNGVKAQGEDIQQIFVDNRPYFGGDLDAALKNIPAETIDKIQVYYKPSDQSKFTGFDDGQSIKVINIITKPDKRDGQFGKAYAGYATNGLHDAKGDLNLFDGNRRITAIGSSIYNTSGQGGISNTNTLGLNYGDSLSKKIFLTGSYAYNNTHNNVQSSLTRAYFAANPQNETYQEKDASGSFGQNQTLNLKMECNFDTFNMLTIAPTFSMNTNNSSSSTNAETNINGEPQSITQNSTSNAATINSGNINVMYGHRFAKKGRTISINLNGSVNNNTNNGTLHANDKYPGSTDSIMELNQQNYLFNYGFNLSPSVNYTEPISKNSNLQFTYSYSFNTNQSSKQTSNYDSLNGRYDRIDTPLTNGFNTMTVLQRGGLGYRINKKNYSLNLDLNYQHETLSGSDDDFNNIPLINKPFNSLLPSLVFNYKFSKKSNININYQTSTSLPSVFQLQNIINNTNPLLLTTGNPNLQQQYTQNLSVRYGLPVSETSSINFNIAASSSMHTIARSDLTASKDSLLPGGYILHQGSRLTMPVNLNGADNARAYISYSIPLKKIESNFNVNCGTSYISAPGLVNNIEGFTTTWNMNASAMLSGHTKEKFDYNLNYSPTYSIVKNSSIPQADNNYYTQNIAARINWTVWKGLVLSTDFNYRIYSGLSTSYNQNYALWNASIGKKFFKKQNGQLKFSVYDILNGQNSLSHTVTDIYVQNRQTNVLVRYYMLSFVYQLRNYKKAIGTKEE